MGPACGSCCGPKNIKYEYKGKTMTIDRKNANTIERFGQGASARIKINKMKKELAKEITGKYI